MSNPSQDVHHCPSCGEKIADGVGEDEVLKCGECGLEIEAGGRAAAHQARPALEGIVQRDVGLHRRQAERTETVGPQKVLPAGELDEGFWEDAPPPDEEVVSDDGRKKVIRRRKKRRKARMGPLLLVCIWVAASLLAVLYVRSRLKEPMSDGKKEEIRKEALERAQRAKYVQEEYAKYRTTIDGFVKAKTMAARTEFVREASRVAPKMEDYYRHELPWVVEGPITLVQSGLFLHGGKRAIETVWGQEGKASREVAFVKDGDRWLIDWEGMVAYSTQPWRLYLEGLGPDRGEFRLYMRERNVEVASDENEMSVLFYPPPEEGEVQWQLASPVVSVSRDSESGRRLKHIVAEAERPRELGDSLFGADDPKGVHRVRVELRRFFDEQGELGMELEEVFSGDWYGEGFESEFPEPEEGEAEGEVGEANGNEDEGKSEREPVPEVPRIEIDGSEQ